MPWKASHVNPYNEAVNYDHIVYINLKKDLIDVINLDELDSGTIGLISSIENNIIK